MTNLIERLNKLISDGWDDTGAPYCLGEEHYQAFCESKAEIERLTAQAEKYSPYSDGAMFAENERLRAEIEQLLKAHAAYEQAITKIEDEWHHD